jgi:hypothetical protein
VDGGIGLDEGLDLGGTAFCGLNSQDSMQKSATEISPLPALPANYHTFTLNERNN